MTRRPVWVLLLSRLRGPDGRIPTRTRWITVAAIVAAVVVTSVAGIFWALIAIIGLIGLIFGITTLVNGSEPRVGLRSRKAGVLATGVSLVLLLVGAGANTAVQQVGGDGDGRSAIAGPTTSAVPSATPTPTPEPVATEEEVQEAVPIPFAAVTVEDATVDVGNTAVTVIGANGEKVTTYLVKYVDGVEVSRSVVREETTREPVNEVTTNGTRVPPPPVAAPVVVNNGCDPNYEGACVPIASDVDCAGGSGNGPGYTTGPVRIVGSDIYDLDRDGDGIACDS